MGVYEKAGFGNAVPRGLRPAVLVVDFTYGFTDKTYSTAADMSAAISATRRLLNTARDVHVPIVFTTIAYSEGEAKALAWLRKAKGMADMRIGTRLVEIDDRLGRQLSEPVVVKHGASAFFGTNLAALLTAQAVDTLIITGATTSGCVRASAVDAVQSGFNVLVPKECVADRAQQPHDANLFDIQQKYGDVISLDDALAYVTDIPAKRSKFDVASPTIIQ